MILGVSLLLYFFFDLIRLIFCLQLIHDIFDLEVSYRKVADFRRTWMNKVAIVDAEKAAALEQLRTVVEREAKVYKEVSLLSIDLQLSGAELDSARQNILALEL